MIGLVPQLVWWLLLQPARAQLTTTAAGSSQKRIQKADLIFVLDYSGSATNRVHDQMVKALKQAVSRLKVSADRVHVGFIKYGNEPEVILSLRNGSKSSLVDHTLDNMPPFKNEWNGIAGGLKAAKKDFEANNRNNTAKILLLISDGHTDCFPEEKSKCFKGSHKDVRKCKMAGRQCSQPKYYICEVLPGYGTTESDSAVFTIAEDLKRMGVIFVSIRYGNNTEKPHWKINMDCWATSQNYSFHVSNYGALVNKLEDMVHRSMENAKVVNCGYKIQNKGPCYIQKGTTKFELLECVQQRQWIPITQPGPGGEACQQQDVLIYYCSLKDCPERRSELTFFVLIKKGTSTKAESSSWLGIFIALTICFLILLIMVLVLVLFVRKRPQRMAKSVGVGPKGGLAQQTRSITMALSKTFGFNDQSVQATPSKSSKSVTSNRSAAPVSSKVKGDSYLRPLNSKN